MDTKEPNKKKNKALILIVIVSLLIIFIISISLLMAKNIATQKNKTAETNTAKDIPVSAEAKALAKTKLIQVQEEKTKLMQEQESAVQKATSTKPAALTASTEKLIGGILKINISSDGFRPLSITAGIGTKVNTEITNIDTVVHNITFESQLLAQYNTTIAPGETKSLTINTPTTPGTYTFSCSIPDHAKNDETGKIIIK